MSELNESIQGMIKTAIQMEKDGFAFYTKSAAQTSSEQGRQIFQSLAEDENMHIQVFSKIFEEAIGKEEWDALVRSSMKYTNIPIFPKDLNEVAGASPDTNDVDAVSIGIDSEKKAIDYYNDIKSQTEDEKIREVLDKIIEQEQSHLLILEGEFQYLSSWGSWHEYTPLGQ